MDDKDGGSTWQHELVPEILWNQTVFGCLDYLRRRTVPIGDWYRLDECTRCRCSDTNGPLMCSQVRCGPPPDCPPTRLVYDSRTCCDVCQPGATDKSASSLTDRIDLRIGAVAATLSLFLMLLFFIVHRVRKKSHWFARLRRLRPLRRENTDRSMDACDSNDTPAGILTADTIFTSGPPIRVADPPPPYSVATAPVNSALPEPPPPYQPTCPVIAVVTVAQHGRLQSLDSCSTEVSSPSSSRSRSYSTSSASTCSCSSCESGVESCTSGTEHSGLRTPQGDQVGFPEITTGGAAEAQSGVGVSRPCRRKRRKLMQQFFRKRQRRQNAAVSTGASNTATASTIAADE